MSLPEIPLIRRVHHWVKRPTGFYFRPDVRHLERIPKAPALLIGNHDGGVLAVDAICFGVAYYEYFDFKRPLSVLMHDYPFALSKRLASFLDRAGLVRASRHALADIFAAGSTALVYPGGDLEAFRPYRKRRHIDLGHRTGFVAEAIRHRVPIVPLASVGAHETLFVLSDGRWLAKHLGLKQLFRSQVFPVIAGLPWGIWANALIPHFPLPAQITVEVQPPIYLDKALGVRMNSDSARDPQILHAGYELVREAIQSALDRLYAARRFPILG